MTKTKEGCRTAWMIAIAVEDSGKGYGRESGKLVVSADVGLVTAGNVFDFIVDCHSQTNKQTNIVLSNPATPPRHFCPQP